MNRDKSGLNCRVAVVAICALLALTVSMERVQAAQRVGASATIRVGEVVGAKQVELKDNSGAKGALVGGAIGLAAGSGKDGKERRKRVGIGAALGAAAGAAKRNPTGMEYSVRAADGTVIVIVTDQMEIRKGDCVAVEESGNRANIRRIAASACEPEAQQVLNDPAVKQEMQEEAAECIAAKEELLAAKTESELAIASRKMEIFCNN